MVSRLTHDLFRVDNPLPVPAPSPAPAYDCLSKVGKSILYIIQLVALSILSCVGLCCCFDWLSRKWTALQSPWAPPPIPANPLPNGPPPEITPDNGIYFEHQTNGANVLCIHPNLISSHPEKVLERFVSINPAPRTIIFLDNYLQKLPITDTGGALRQFITHLSLALFSQEDRRLIKFDPSTKLPVIDEDTALITRLTLSNVGKLFSYIEVMNTSLDHPISLSTGRILPDSFFELLHLANQSNNHPTIEKIASILAPTLSENKTVVLNLISYLHGTGDVAATKSFLLNLGYESASITDAQDLLEGYFRGVFDAAQIVCNSMSFSLKNQLQYEEGKVCSNFIQGLPLSAQELCNRITYVNPNTLPDYENVALPFNTPQLQAQAIANVSWLKNEITRRLAIDDIAWVETLLLALTGSRSVTATTRIQFTLSASETKVITCRHLVFLGQNYGAHSLARFQNFINNLVAQPTLMSDQ